MRQILAMLENSVLRTLRDRGELFSIIVLPLVLTAVFGLVFSSASQERASRVLFVDQDGSAVADQILRLLEAEKSIEVETETETEAKRMLRDGQAAAAVFVPKGFTAAVMLRASVTTTGSAGWNEEETTIRFLKNPTSSAAPVIEQLVQGVATRLSADVLAAQESVGAEAPRFTPGGGATPRMPPDFYFMAESAWDPVPPVYVESAAVTESSVRGEGVMASGFEQYSMGFTLMFAMFIAFAGAGGILEEREQGTLRRLLVAPVSRAQLVAGKTASVVLLAAVEAATLVAFGALLFGVPWGRSPLGLVMVLGAYVLAISGLAVLVASLVRSRSQLSGLTPLVATGLSMLGGCYWTLDMVPPVMRTIGRLTPTGWAMIGLTDLVARNQGVSAAFVPSLVLLGSAAVTFGLGLALLRFE